MQPDVEKTNRCGEIRIIQRGGDVQRDLRRGVGLEVKPVLKIDTRTHAQADRQAERGRHREIEIARRREIQPGDAVAEIERFAERDWVEAEGGRDFDYAVGPGAGGRQSDRVHVHADLRGQLANQALERGNLEVQGSRIR